MRYDLSTRFFHKKSKLIWFLSLITQELIWITAGLKEFLSMIKRPYEKFLFVIKVFHDFGYGFVSKRIKLIHTFAFFSFSSTCYLVSLIMAKYYIIGVWRRRNEYILRAEIWLDGFDSVFWQDSVEFFLLFFVVLFSQLKKWIRTGHNALL